MSKNIKITIIGAGYVGMSLAAVLSKKNIVKVLDIDKHKIDLINNFKSTIKDNDIEKFLEDKNLTLSGTTLKEDAYNDADFYIIATPTDFDPEKNYFDTSSVEKTIKDILTVNKNANIIIKSTVPIGFTKHLNKIFKTDRIIFSPEFLREGRALHDNLYPSRIVIGGKSQAAKVFSSILKNCSLSNEVEIIEMDSSDAEAVKLFANSYLAMRVSYFNELDTFALSKELSTKDIIKGISSDPRIGNHYNNPSFGYGGYCLPKDTKQLLANFEDIPQNIFTAIVSSNSTRKKFITDKIIELKPRVIGFYRLVMKEGSDNFRVSAIQEIIRHIKEMHSFEILIYEPTIHDNKFLDYEIINDLDAFKKKSDIIIANRQSKDLKDASEKVFTRDIFGTD